MSAYIAGYARTPFTKFTGQLATETAVDLGARGHSRT
jgi:acetyl-CoA C-acetyltransferase